MKNLNFYIDAAREKTGSTSDLQLAKILNLKSSAISYWRTKKTLPSDEVMIKLADVAGISKEQALLELSYWRADGEAKSTYEKILKRISFFIPATLFSLSLLHPDAAQAAQSVIKTATSLPHDTLHHALQECITLCNNNIDYGKEKKIQFNKAAQKQSFNQPVQKYVSGRKTAFYGV